MNAPVHPSRARQLEPTCSLPKPPAFPRTGLASGEPECRLSADRLRRTHASHVVGSDSNDSSGTHQIIRRLECERDMLRRMVQDDQRKACELKELVLAHLANGERLVSLSQGSASESAVCEAQRAYDRSQSELYPVIEDTFCVDAKTLARALTL